LTTNNLLEQGIALPIMEEFYSLQGEGFHTGKAAYFLRIGGCDVGCSFCDTKESWDANRHPLVLVDNVINNILQSSATTVVITGGEPCLYNLSYLCQEVAKHKIALHLETSGSEKLSGNWNWICFSPKRKTIIQPEFYQKANELKVIVEESIDLLWAEENAEKINKKCELFLQPEWSQRETILPLIVNYILLHPKWKISLQSHKYMRIP